MELNDHKQATFKKACNSGKKTHTVKNNVLTTPERSVLWLSRTCKGSKHDIEIFDNQPIQFPSSITLWQDKVFFVYNP